MAPTSHLLSLTLGIPKLGAAYTTASTRRVPRPSSQLLIDWRIGDTVHSALNSL